MLRTLPPPSPTRRRGAQPRNTNARKHGFYSAHPPSPIQTDSQYLQLLSRSHEPASQARCIALLEQHLRDTSALLNDHFLATDDAHFLPDTIGKFERFFRTLSYELRLKRTLKKWRDEHDFLPNLAKNALSLATLEFTDLRISVFATYGANQPAGDSTFVPQFFTKNHTITNLESMDSSPFLPEDPVFSSLFPDPAPIVPQTIPNNGHSIRSFGRAGVQPAPPTLAHAAPEQLLTKNHMIMTGESRAFSTENPPFSPFLSNPTSAVPSGEPASCPPRPHPPQGRRVQQSEVPSTDNCQPAPINGFPLTPSQSAFLVPVLASLRSQLNDMAIRRRQHPESDLFVLQVILLRLALNLRWTDLPAHLPLRACQLLYKRLCTSGRMQLIYRLLYEDLSINGRKNLFEMVDSGTFQYENSRIYLRANKPVLWESLTGLLLLQRACFNQRRLKRVDHLEKHGPSRRGGSRLAPDDSLEAIIRASAKPQPDRSSRPAHRISSRLPASSIGLISVDGACLTDPILHEKLKRLRDEPFNNSP